MTSSRRKADANRRNALKSTGPKSAEGKGKSRWNSLKHGACAELLLCQNPEQQAVFRQLLSDLRSSCKPVGILEDIIIGEIGCIVWKLGRCVSWEQAVLRARRNPTARALLEAVVESSDLEHLDLSQLNEAGDTESSEAPFPWECSELLLQMRSSRRDSDCQAGVGGNEEIDVNAKHTDIRVHLKDALDVVRRYQKGLQNDLYKAIAKLQELQDRRRKNE